MKLQLGHIRNNQFKTLHQQKLMIQSQLLLALCFICSTIFIYILKSIFKIRNFHLLFAKKVELIDFCQQNEENLESGCESVKGLLLEMIDTLGYFSKSLFCWGEKWVFPQNKQLWQKRIISCKAMFTSNMYTISGTYLEAMFYQPSLGKFEEKKKKN